MCESHGKNCDQRNNYETFDKRNMKFFVFHFSALTIKKDTIVQRTNRVPKKVQTNSSGLLIRIPIGIVQIGNKKCLGHSKYIYNY